MAAEIRDQRLVTDSKQQGQHTGSTAGVLETSRVAEHKRGHHKSPPVAAPHPFPIRFPALCGHVGVTGRAESQGQGQQGAATSRRTPTHRIRPQDLQVGLLRLQQLRHHLQEALHKEVDALAVAGHEELVQGLHGNTHVPGSRQRPESLPDSSTGPQPSLLLPSPKPPGCPPTKCQPPALASPRRKVLHPKYLWDIFRWCWLLPTFLLLAKTRLPQDQGCQQHLASPPTLPVGFTCPELVFTPREGALGFVQGRHRVKRSPSCRPSWSWPGRRDKRRTYN